MQSKIRVTSRRILIWWRIQQLPLQALEEERIFRVVLKKLPELQRLQWGQFQMQDNLDDADIQTLMVARSEQQLHACTPMLNCVPYRYHNH
jgi:hypothetical protein